MITLIFILLIAHMVVSLAIVIVAFMWSEKVDEELDMHYEVFKEHSDRIEKIEEFAHRKMKLQLNSMYGKMMKESEDNINGQSED